MDPTDSMLRAARSMRLQRRSWQYTPDMQADFRWFAAYMNRPDHMFTRTSPRDLVAEALRDQGQPEHVIVHKGSSVGSTVALLREHLAHFGKAKKPPRWTIATNDEARMVFGRW